MKEVRIPIRVKEWWQYKTPFVLALPYAAAILQGKLPSWSTLTLFLISYIGWAAFGYLLNDWFDRASDKAAGKANRLAAFPAYGFALLLLASLALGLAPWAFYPGTPLLYLLLGIEGCLLLSYSVPPLRLKDRRWLAVCADGLYGFVIPFWIAAAVFVDARQPVIIALLFSAWLFVTGLRNILMHQFLDHDNDRASGTGSVVVLRGASWARRMIDQRLSISELALFTGLCFALGGAFRWVPLIFLIHSVLAYKRELASLQTNGNRLPPGYLFIGDIVLNEFYQCWLPLVLLAFYTSGDMQGWLLIGLHLSLFHAQSMILINYVRGGISLLYRGGLQRGYHKARSLGLRIAYKAYKLGKVSAYTYLYLPVKKLVNKPGPATHE